MHLCKTRPEGRTNQQHSTFFESQITSSIRAGVVLDIHNSTVVYFLVMLFCTIFGELNPPDLSHLTKDLISKHIRGGDEGCL